MAILAPTTRLRTQFDVETAFAWQENRIGQNACHCKRWRRDQAFDFTVMKLIKFRDGPTPPVPHSICSEMHRFPSIHVLMLSVVAHLHRRQQRVRYLAGRRDS